VSIALQSVAHYETMTSERFSDLAAGTRVEVRNRFDGSWAAGFELAEPIDDHGWHVRRLSDGSVLPSPFPHEEVRAERGR
jgi:hypothetical protein